MTDVIIYPSDDSWVAQDSSGSNYGSQTTMQVCNQSGYLRYSYLLFSLAAIPVGSIITAATLYFYKTAGTGQNTVVLNLVTGSWSEGAITYNNKPTDDATAIATFNLSSTGWKNCGGASLNTVKGWFEGSIPNYGFVLKCSGSAVDGAHFIATSEAASNKPYLVVSYSDAFIPKIIIF